MCPKVSATTSSCNLKLQWSKDGHTYTWRFFGSFWFLKCRLCRCFVCRKPSTSPTSFERMTSFSAHSPHLTQHRAISHTPCISHPNHRVPLATRKLALPPLFQHTAYCYRGWLAMLSDWCCEECRKNFIISLYLSDEEWLALHHLWATKQKD